MEALKRIEENKKKPQKKSLEIVWKSVEIDNVIIIKISFINSLKI